jgi:chemotaxis protein methyltransferase CheR
MEEQDFLTLKRYIETTLNVQCSNYKEEYIKRRLSSRMRSTGKETYASYLTYLKSTPDELEPLRKALTIHVTEFFRDFDVFEAIRTSVIPDLLKQKIRLRIWSAGCSTGEEPYSLAMILYEYLQKNKNISCMIYATDVDEPTLERAKEGIYDPKALQKMSETQIRRHFIMLPDGMYQVRPHLKELIKFRRHDLMSGIPVSRFLDMVTCRNVTIYFTEKQKNDLARLFHEALVPGGFYVMGKTEYLAKEVENLFIPYNPTQKIFIKPK